MLLMMKITRVDPATNAVSVGRISSRKVSLGLIRRGGSQAGSHFKYLASALNNGTEYSLLSFSKPTLLKTAATERERERRITKEIKRE